MTTTLSSNEIKGLSSHYACLNLAADYIDRADEERNLAKNLLDQIQNLAGMIIVAVGVLVASTMVAMLVGSELAGSVTLITPVLYLGFLGVGSVMSIAVSVLAYQMFQRSSHLGIARNFEHKSMEANLRAAEIPSYRDYGIIARFLGSLFHTGNPVTRFGRENLGGQRANRFNSYRW